MTFWWVLLAVFAASWFFTLLLRRYALARSLIDIPNIRSSHTVPTPRGGGVAIVVSFLSALLFLVTNSLIGAEEFYALLGSGFVVAIIGFADDHGHIAARWRLLGHFFSAAWALYWLNGLAPLSYFGVAIDLRWTGSIFAAFYLVWMLNLYNFMDGIDGLASAEAICVCVGVAVIYWFAGHLSLVDAPVLLAAAVAGFLYWNFPPAKIFMGDAGSGFLGVILGILSLKAAWAAPELFWVWIIMLGVFIVDATWTLFRRLIRGDAVLQAHRSHAYQYASRLFNSHKKVTVAIVLINTFWLWPIGMLVGMRYLEPVLGVLLAYVPLAGVVCYFRAGSLESGAAS